jgi:Flp pilus assembly protein TadG
MILVAIAMLSMLAMVALAIDVITLYSARSEAQSAADAAALAAAKMLVDSGVTADPTNGTLQTAAQTAAAQGAQDVAGKVKIAGRLVQTSDVTVTFPNAGQPSFGINPTVQVTVVNANLPTFFSRIWSRTTLTVRVSAKAEAFNPSNSSSIGAGVPTAPRCVKPFLLPNCDPVNPSNHGSNCGGGFATFFDATTGAITNPGQYPAGVIGETFTVRSNCTGSGPSCTPGPPTASPLLLYYPAQLPVAAGGNACPGPAASCSIGVTAFQSDLECCNPTPLSCGATAAPLPLDTTVFPEGNAGPAQSGVDCLIHKQPGNGQDILNQTALPGALTYPLQIQAGGNHPLAGTPSLNVNDFITSSDSLITVPVYDPAPGVPPAGPVQIIGFLQLFIVDSFTGGGPKAGEFTVTVVNVSGCGSSATGTPVYGSGVTGIPVRLIQ